MTDGVHGYVLKDPSDVAGLADGMKKMMKAEHLAVMSRACIELRPALSYEHHVQSLTQIYREVIESRKRP